MNISEDRVETRFLANMSHEIRTPMNSIMGFLELVLEDQQLANQHRSNLSTALNSSRHLLTLLDNILDLSRLESHDVVVNLRQFDIQVVLGTLNTQWLQIAQKKGLYFTIECDPSLHGFYFCDAYIIDKILSLLIDNAIKFTDHGAVTLIVTPGLVQGTISFSVRDTGVGIHPAFLDEIFQPFMQGDSTNSRSYEGVGLGTTIALRFAQLLDGDIAVETHYGSGSMFTLTIPLQVCPDTYPSVKMETTHATHDLAARKFQILLVDDVETNLELARVHLRRRGQDVDTASNGLEAIDCTEEKSYDVILMDIHMPIMDGIESMKQIRSAEGDTKHTIIIALTADQMSEVRLPLIDKGFDDVVGKPVNFEELMKMLQNALPAELGTQIISDVVVPLAKTTQKRLLGDQDVKELLSDIKEKMGTYNPTKVFPLLEDMHEILGENRLLTSISGLVETYEFDSAVHELERLAHSLNYELE